MTASRPASTSSTTEPLAGPGEPSGPGELLVVGRIVRPHGLRGEVVVELTTNRVERVAAGAFLTTGDGRVLEVVRSSPRGGGSGASGGARQAARSSRHLVAFAGVGSTEAAESLRDLELLAPPVDDPDVLWIHDLIGSTVLDPDGRRLGVVREVQANPASDLLVLESGALVPLTFVVGTDPGVSVTVDVPEGLLDLT